VDNRLSFYKINQREVPSITGDVIPQRISSFREYKSGVIDQYSLDLAQIGASRAILFKEWINSRGVIFRFDRAALEVRARDAQECVKSDVALSCFVRASLRGLVSCEEELLPHDLLVSDFNSVIAGGLNAKVKNPHGGTAQQVCQHYYDVAWENADEEEKKYLPLVRKRIEKGSLSDIIREKVLKKAQRTDFKEAIVNIYSKLIKSLTTNEPYF